MNGASRFCAVAASTTAQAAITWKATLRLVMQQFDPSVSCPCKPQLAVFDAEGRQAFRHRARHGKAELTCEPDRMLPGSSCDRRSGKRWSRVCFHGARTAVPRRADGIDLPEAEVAGGGFRCSVPQDRRFRVANLFEFRRGRGDFVFSIVILVVALILLWQFAAESGWDKRELPQRRVGKILKQPWVGPLMCMSIIVPAALHNPFASWRARRRDARLRLPDRTAYEIGQSARSFEFIAYTWVIGILGYLVSAVLFGLFLTLRLGYRSGRWIAISLAAGLSVVVVFRKLLQIKTPVNIWLNNQLPTPFDTFMKIYF